MSTKKSNKQTAIAKNKGYRVVAIILMVLSLIALFLPIRTYAGNKVSTHISFALLGQMFSSPYKKWGFIPMLGDPICATTRLGSYAIICFIVAMLVVFAASIVAIVLSAKFPKSKAAGVLTSAAVFAFTLASAVYSLVITTISSYAPNTTVIVDATTVVLTVLGSIAYLFLLIQKYKAGCLFYIVQFVLTFTVLAFVVLAFTHRGENVSTSLDVRRVYKVFSMLFILGMTAVVGMSSLCLFYPQKKKVNNAFSISVLFFQTGIIFGMALLAAVADIHVRDYEIYTFVAGIITFVQFLGIILWIALTGNKAEDPFSPISNNFINELEEDEYIEVRPYDGGPVAGIYEAELVEESIEVVPYNGEPVDEVVTAEVVEEDAAPAEAEAEACEASEEGEVTEGEEAEAEEEITDAFMATLTEEERAQFTDIYVTKSINMPEIPAYVVDGDNKDFFNKVFIYIGQYRQNIPNGLLAKMYDFSLTL